MEHAHIHITGIVQGVGMRPFVYREAMAHGIGGWVLNAGDGVHIEAHGDSAALAAFIRDLRAHAPAASRIDTIEVSELGTDEGPKRTDGPESHSGASKAQVNGVGNARDTDDMPAPAFRIIASEDRAAHTTLVSPDIATCDDCLHELFDPADRRYHYPFINCTNCGPRFTIIHDLPYDRAKTSMDAFPMCDTCATEYADPLDRRFHAQPDACFDCGPHITWREEPTAGETVSGGDTPSRAEVAAGHGSIRGAAETAASCDSIHSEAGAAAGRDDMRSEAGAVADRGGMRSAAAATASCDRTRDATAATGGRSTRGATGTTGGRNNMRSATPAIGTTREASDAIIARCAELLEAGGIVAIKGLGGFHLACRADAEATVAELRRRKHRGRKPLAIMVRNLGIADALCHLNDTERDLLQGSVRPIVLARLRTNDPNGSTDATTNAGTDQAAEAQPTANSAAAATADAADPDRPARMATSGKRGSPDAPIIAPQLAPSVTCGLPSAGIMLPYTPLQHLLMAACAARDVHTLVMTSGNVSGSPIETDDERAWGTLVEGGIADALLGNDRPILTRYDDSVVMVSDATARPVRRARGYAPRPLALPARAPRDPGPAIADGACCVLACGPEQKSTLAYTRERADGEASCFVSQHIGDLDNAQTLDAWHEARTRLAALFDLHPTVLACDAHPAYLSSQWARAEALRAHLPLIEVQHHHAHIASVIADAAARDAHDPTQPVIGIALDGTGAGATFDAEGTPQPDGTVWGGEVLVASLTGMQRAAHLRCWRLPGGVASVRDARRCAWSLLASYRLLDHPGAAELVSALSLQERTLMETMVARGLNSPFTSSAGRLLDAIAALLGICHRATYDGEPAIALEAAALRASRCESGPAPELPARPMTPEGASAAAGPAAAAGVATASTPIKPDAPASAPAPAAPAVCARPATQARNQNAPGLALAGNTSANTDRSSTAPAEIGVEALLAHLLDGLARGEDRDGLARDAHLLFARLMAHAAIDTARKHGISSVALSGGVFTNRLLLRDITNILARHGLTVLTPHTVPFNDGCIAYGQAAIARACIFAAKRPSRAYGERRQG